MWGRKRNLAWFPTLLAEFDKHLYMRRQCTLTGVQCAFFAVLRLYPRGIFLNILTSLFSRMRYKWCKFGSERWATNGTLVEQQCASSAVSRLVLRGLYSNFTPRSTHTFATYDARLASIDQKLKALYYMSNVPSRLYFGFLSRDFPENSYAKFRMHPLKTEQVWLCSVKNEGHSTWTAVSFRLFLRFHWSDFTEQSTFSSVSRLPLEELSWNLVTHTCNACATNDARLIVIDQ
jgi:hypothetical protein